MTPEQKAADLKVKQDALTALKAASPLDAAAIAAKQAEVDAAQKVVSEV